MKGVEAAPLTYVIAAIAVVIALSILVTMGQTVRGGVSQATETLNKSLTAGAQKATQELGEIYGKDDVVIVSVEKSAAKVSFNIYNWENAAKFDLIIDDSNSSKKDQLTNASVAGYCSSGDADGDGSADDLICAYDSPENNLTNGTVKVTIYDSNGKVLSSHQYLYK